jgi:hypothetical protein
MMALLVSSKKEGEKWGHPISRFIEKIPLLFMTGKYRYLEEPKL